MGSGTENKGYVEMWGGTSKYYTDERHPIGPGEMIEWTYMFRLSRLVGISCREYSGNTEDVILNTGVIRGFF